MTPENFCYWIQGLMELNPDLKTLNEEQVKMIREHLALVFTNVSKDKKPVSKTDWQKVLKDLPKEYCSSTSTYVPTTVSCSPPKFC